MSSGPAEAVIEADGVRVVFYRDGDRYAHGVEVFDAGQGSWQRVWESLEGAADDVWPPSPPLQQLHIERRAEGPVALLVGMAGRTHWSAAVEVIGRKVAGSESGGTRSIRFDVAARIPATVRGGEGHSPSRLGSTYRIQSSGAAVRIRLLPLESTEFAQVRSAVDERCFVRPSSPWADSSDVSRTVSWQYVIEPME
jgi:hypothetical protein